jgi:hypothetical protein
MIDYTVKHFGIDRTEPHVLKKKSFQILVVSSREIGVTLLAWLANCVQKLQILIRVEVQALVIWSPGPLAPFLRAP